ncbi:MAG: replication initiator protein A [Mycoplasmoidaceae bacterium]|nr:replication initiator protein A [Mycoplasmoidaceae bacterium]
MTNITTNLNFTYIFCGKHNKPEQFVMLPKFVLDMRISCRAKLLYSFMLDRTKLSLENHWSDSQGKVYIKFSLMSIQKILDCSKNTATNVLEELKHHKLIEAKKDEFGKCNKIFVKYPEQKEEQKPDEEPKKQEHDETSYLQESLDNESYPQKSESYQQVYDSQNQNMQNIGALSQILTPLSQILTSLSQILTPNHTNINHININNQSSIYNNTKTDKYNVDMDMIEQQQQDYENYQKSIKENIDYTTLKEKYDIDTINDIVDTMCDVMISNHKTTRVNGQNISTKLVKNAFTKLKMSNIEYVLECLKMTPKINNIRAYLITTLYNSIKTRHLFYTYAATSEASEVSKTKQEYSKPVKKNKFCNYKQREWDFEELERLARERLKNSTPDFEFAWGKDGHILKDENNRPIKIYLNQKLPRNIGKNENGKYYFKICDTQGMKNSQ